MEPKKEILTDLIEMIKREETTQKKVIADLQKIADELDIKHRDMTIANTSFAAAGIVSSALTIVGIAAAPFTFVASLGLTVAGTVLGVSSGAGGVATLIAKNVMNKETLKNAQERINAYTVIAKDLVNLAEQIKTFHQTKLMRCLKKMKSQAKDEAQTEIYERILQDLSHGFGLETDNISTAVGAARLSGTASQIGVVAAKTVGEVMEGGVKGLRHGGIVLSVLTVPLDIHIIVTNSIKIHRMTPSETSKEIRRLAKYLLNDGKLQEKEKALNSLHSEALKYDRVDWNISKVKLLLLLIQVYGSILIAIGLFSSIVGLSFEHLIRFGIVIVIQSGIIGLCVEMYIEFESSLIWEKAETKLDKIMKENFSDDGNEKDRYNILQNLYCHFKNNVLNGQYPLTNFRDYILLAVKLCFDILGVCYCFNTPSFVNLEAEISTEMIPLQEALTVYGETEQRYQSATERIQHGGILLFLLSFPICLYMILICVEEMYGRKKTEFRNGVDVFVDDIRQEVHLVHSSD